MSQINETNKIVANPSILQIGFSFFGVLFFSALAYLMYDSDWGDHESNGYIMIAVIFAAFCFFTLACLYMFLTSKKLELTNDTFTIAYPYLFCTKTIDLNDIRKVTEGDYAIERSDYYTKSDIYKGKKITVEFFESKKIVITSLEITNYILLANNLKNCSKTYFKLTTMNQDTKNIQGYGWLLIMVFLTLGLVISLLTRD